MLCCMYQKRLQDGLALTQSSYHRPIWTLVSHGHCHKVQRQDIPFAYERVTVTGRTIEGMCAALEALIKWYCGTDASVFVQEVQGVLLTQTILAQQEQYQHCQGRHSGCH